MVLTDELCDKLCSAAREKSKEPGQRTGRLFCISQKPEISPEKRYFCTLGIVIE